MMKELELIEFFKNQQKKHPQIIKGIGDDAAVIRWTDHGRLVSAQDTLCEGVHFDSSLTSFERIGYKSLAVNLSDFAAMGALPKWFLVSLTLPRQMQENDVKELYRGFQPLIERFDLALIGGDTNIWEDKLTISITVLGTGDQNTIFRDGAKPRDKILVTGFLGNSRLEHEFNFVPRVKESLHLVQNFDIHAMIDISDGLATDLRHILRQSGLGAILESEKLPLRKSKKMSLNTPHQALSDGEDFELCFCTSAKTANKIIKTQPLDSCPITEIGWVTPSQEFLLKDEAGVSPIELKGYEHCSSPE